ncbi:stage III sporulation protein AE [Sporosarcina gallistercoris]|uniref:Stage III sporulation protein AE n=1 Tax=Sporosarcina gallistercoris TaxID=2762245 RepID=A0ABR8PF44_9BACL|nr:stage III sporulation protein AE [Sporosarcina gallistercoris]MBD7906796.1 stage III sporulation protein AE [Sporosarcina gallistercoris]
MITILDFLHSLISGLLYSFIVVIIIALMATVLNYLFPSFSDWTKQLLYIVIVLVVLRPAFEQLLLIQKLMKSIAMLFVTSYPILTAGMAISGNALSLLNFQPALLLFANGAVFFADRLLLPLVTTALLFDIVTRLNPLISYSKLSDMLRTTLLAVVSSIVAAYSIFITAGGAVSWGISEAASEPLKELIRQNIPFVGSFVTDSMGALGRYSSGAGLMVGGWLLVTLWGIAILPVVQTLLLAFLYRWCAALIEPFTSSELSDVLDDIGRSLFVLCAITFLMIFAFVYTVLFFIVFVKLSMR